MLFAVILLKPLSMMLTSVRWRMKRMRVSATGLHDLQVLFKDLHATGAEEGELCSAKRSMYEHALFPVLEYQITYNSQFIYS